MPMTTETNRVTQNTATDEPFEKEVSSVVGGTNETEYKFQEYKEDFDHLEGTWSEEDTKLKRYRDMRKIRVDVRQLRIDKILAKDETLVPPRLIDDNIRREIPTYVQYLLQSRRIAIFKPVNSDFQTELLEGEFTRVFKHPSWELDFFRMIDGKVFLGWDSLEILFDETMPGHFMLRHVGRDKIRFNRDAVSIQACAKVILIYQLSTSQLKRFVKKYGWSKAEVDNLVEKKKDGKGGNKCEDYVFEIRKVYFKTEKDEFIRVAWYSKDGNDWLSVPRPLWLGKTKKVEKLVPIEVNVLGVPAITQQPQIISENIYETEYPIYVATYMETEEKKILCKEGRAFLDEHKQEAATAIRSAIVNTAVRSSNVYASPKGATGTGTGVPKASTNTLINGAIYDNPLEFWGSKSVDAALVKVDQMLQVNNAAETNNVAWAVNNREDSRKTATEISSVQQKESEVNSVQVVLFSKFMRDICIRLWSIVQNRAANGFLVDFLQNTPLGYKEQALALSYNIFAAGDVDVIKRDQDLAKMKQDWPVVSNVPQLNLIFLSDYFRKAYPTEGEKYSAILLKQVTENTQMQAIVKVLQGMIQQFGTQMTPEQQAQIAQLMGGLNANV